MVAELISVRELKEEVIAIISVCFEGEVVDLGDRVGLILPNGQCFSFRIEEV